MSVSCCKDCKERYQGCHDRCETYLESKKKHIEEQERIRKMRAYLYPTYLPMGKKKKLNNGDYYKGDIKDD